jgi:hypothetical protein
MRRALGGAIVDSLVKVEANKHPVSVIWAIETSVLRDIAVLLVVYGALVLLATVLAGQIDRQSPSGAGLHPPSDTIQ